MTASIHYAVAMTTRRLPAPWSADKMPGGYVVRDANGQAIAYVYSRATETDAMQAKVLTDDEARVAGQPGDKERPAGNALELIPGGPNLRH